MVAISIMIEGQTGVTWPHWKRLVAEVEDLGFAGMFRSDHFTSARPPDRASLETIVSLTYLADHTRRIHFGPLVAPFSFRHPVFLARQDGMTERKRGDQGPKMDKIGRAHV